MNTQLLQFLRDLAEDPKHNGCFEPLETSAVFDMRYCETAKGVLPGAVYCIAVYLADRDAQTLEQEALQKKSLKTPLKRIRRLPLETEKGKSVYPLYWGKDEAVGFRLYRHILDKNPKAGCLGIRFYEALGQRSILAASLPLKDFARFETLVEKEYPSMLYSIKKNNIDEYSRL